MRIIPALILALPFAALGAPAGVPVTFNRQIAPIIYRNLAVPLGVTEDKWGRAIGMRGSAGAVVHHVLYFADPKGRAHERPPQGGEPGFSGMLAGGASVPLGGWALGAQPHRYPHGL